MHLLVDKVYRFLTSISTLNPDNGSKVHTFQGLKYLYNFFMKFWLFWQKGKTISLDKKLCIIEGVFGNIGDGVLFFGKNFDGLVVDFKVMEEDGFEGKKRVDMGKEIELGVIEGDWMDFSLHDKFNFINLFLIWYINFISPLNG